jgi:hypothetical protein
LNDIYIIFSLFLAWEIYDMDSFAIPCNHDVVILIVIVIKCDVQLNLVSFHAFILITWHGWFCLTDKDNPRKKHFFQVYFFDYQKIIWVIHVKIKNSQNPFSSPLDSWNESRSFQPLDVMKNHVCKDHIALQLELKNHSSTITLQLRPPKCNSYATTLYK